MIRTVNLSDWNDMLTTIDVAWTDERERKIKNMAERIHSNAAQILGEYVHSEQYFSMIFMPKHVVSVCARCARSKLHHDDIAANWTVNKSRPKLIALVSFCIRPYRSAENLKKYHRFIFTNVVSRFTLYVPTMSASSSSGMLRRCHIANRAHVHICGNKKCTRGHPFSFRAALCAFSLSLSILRRFAGVADWLAAPLFNLQNVN